MKIALITGASGGLGRQFAVHIDQEENDIEEIWLLARRQDKLEETGRLLKKPYRVLPLDLLNKDSFETVKTMLSGANAEVGIFVNNAGFGKIGNYAQLSMQETDQMIDLNCKAAVDMTVTCIPFMKAGDRILEICSTAAFQPIQHMNVYAATKSFLYNYSRALRMELLPKKIIVTAVCPYWMTDTGFIPTARNTENKADTKKAIKHFALGVPSDKVAVRTLRASRRGAAVCTPGIFCSVHRFFGKLLPRNVMMYIWEGIRRI